MKLSLWSWSVLLIVVFNSAAYSENINKNSLYNFGGVGLLQVPTARMLTAGSISSYYSFSKPYNRYAVSAQPFENIEAAVRYTSVNFLEYGVTSQQTYKDKAIDVKFLLVNESFYLPEISLGLRDFSGTSEFSSEYLVASKRWNNFDFTLGIGWGKLGKRNSFTNPLSLIWDKFKYRDRNAIDFSSLSYFHGDMAIFGGIEYQTMWNRLKLKLEYDSNNYENEIGNVNLYSKTGFNFGLQYNVIDDLYVNVSYERGSEITAGFGMFVNLAKYKRQTKLDILVPKIKVAEHTEINKVVKLLQSLKITVVKIIKGNQTISVYLDNTSYAWSAEMYGIVSRVLANNLPLDIKYFNLVLMKSGMELNSLSVNRDLFIKAVANKIPDKKLYESLHKNQVLVNNPKLIYQRSKFDFDYSISPSLNFNIGGPDSFILYQAQINVGSTVKITEGLQLSSLMSAGVYDNYELYTYDVDNHTANSKIPRVRSHIKDYAKGSKFWIDNLQLTYNKKLGKNLYTITYAGLLESMFMGVGFEALYRLPDSNWALGFDANYVKQRDFKRLFGTRDYSVFTGHASLYYKHKPSNIRLKLSFGKYLAKDVGGTLDIARYFKNGVKFGVFATKTNISSKEFGEGAFDKGIYFEVPLDIVSFHHTSESIGVVWKPLIKDGGAKLVKSQSLYNMTESLDYENMNYVEELFIGVKAPNFN